MRFARRARGVAGRCVYYPEAGIARVELTVTWESQAHRKFSLDGTLHLSRDDYRWEQGSGNLAFRQLQREKDDLKGGLILGGLALAAIAAAVADSDDEPSTPRKRGRAVTCLSNNVLDPFYLKYRWRGASGRRGDTLPRNQLFRFKSSRYDTLEVRFDDGLGDGAYTGRTYRLPATRVTSSDDPPCQATSHYELRRTGSSLTVGRRTRR